MIEIFWSEPNPDSCATVMLHSSEVFFDDYGLTDMLKAVKLAMKKHKGKNVQIRDSCKGVRVQLDLTSNARPGGLQEIQKMLEELYK